MKVSRAKHATTQYPGNIHTINPSPQNPALKRSYSQVVQTRKPTRDPEKQARDHGKVSPDQSRDLSVLSMSRDPTRSHDPGIQAHDHTWSRGTTRFARATHPLNNTWQTVGTHQQMTKPKGFPRVGEIPKRGFPPGPKKDRASAQYCAAVIGTPPYS